MFTTAPQKDAQLGSCSRDPIGYKVGRSNMFEYVESNSLRNNDPSGLDRRIMMWLSHMYICVDTCDASGAVNGQACLHFSPEGYTIEPAPMWPSFQMGHRNSSCACDKLVIDLWGFLERERKKERVRNWGPVNNCWLPSLAYLDYGDCTYNIAPPMDILDPVGP